MALLVALDSPVQQETSASLDQVDHWDLLGSQDLQVHLDKRVLLVMLDPQGLLDLPDLQGNQVN